MQKLIILFWSGIADFKLPVVLKSYIIVENIKNIQNKYSDFPVKLIMWGEKTWS